MSADLQLTPDGGLMLHVRLAAAVLGRHLLKPENGGELDSLHFVDLETGDCENLVNPFNVALPRKEVFNSIVDQTAAGRRVVRRHNVRDGEGKQSCWEVPAVPKPSGLAFVPWRMYFCDRKLL